MKKRLARFAVSAFAFVMSIAASVVGFGLMAGFIEQTLLIRVICSIVLVLAPISVIQLINKLYQTPVHAIEMTKEQIKEEKAALKEASKEAKEKKKRTKMYDTEPLPVIHDDYDDDYKEYDE